MLVSLYNLRAKLHNTYFYQIKWLLCVKGVFTYDYIFRLR